MWGQEMLSGKNIDRCLRWQRRYPAGPGSDPPRTRGHTVPPSVRSRARCVCWPGGCRRWRSRWPCWRWPRPSCRSRTWSSCCSRWGSPTGRRKSWTGSASLPRDHLLQSEYKENYTEARVGLTLPLIVYADWEPLCSWPLYGWQRWTPA